MDGGAWWAAAHGVAKSQTRLSDFTFNTVGQFFPHPFTRSSTCFLYLNCLSGAMRSLKKRNEPNCLFLVFPDPKKERFLG